MSGEKIIEGLQEAVAYASVDDTSARVQQHRPTGRLRYNSQGTLQQEWLITWTKYVIDVPHTEGRTEWRDVPTEK